MRGAPGQDDHWTDTRPWDPHDVDRLTPELERFYLANQWTLMWWKFRRHRLAVISGIILLATFFSIAVSEILAPYNLHTRNTDHIYAPPQMVRLFHEGRFVGLFVYGYDYHLDMSNLQRVHTPDRTKIERLRFFCLGDAYTFWGMVEMRFHVVCPAEGGTLFLLGTDRLGRDLLSRILMGARIVSVWSDRSCG